MSPDSRGVPIETVRNAFRSISSQSLHDVQTPLAVIRMNARQMVSFFNHATFFQEANADLQHYLLQSAEHIAEAAQYINGVLNLFSACFQEIGPINEQERFSLKSCLEKALLDYPYKHSELKEAVRWEFRGEEDFFIFGSYGHFVRLFQYFLRNVLRQCRQEHLVGPSKIVLSLEKAQGLVSLEGNFYFPSGDSFPMEKGECEAALEWNYIYNVIKAHGGKLNYTKNGLQFWLPMETAACVDSKPVQASNQRDI